MLALREAFRDTIERALARRPVVTPRGHVARDRVAVRMGSPGGTHGELSTWVYARSGTELEMIVGFFELFTPDDVICKVVPAGAYPRSDEGASVQLNADRCLVLVDGGIQLVHHGRVSASGSISRDRLCEVANELCPDELAALGLRDASSWPHVIGASSDVPALLDHLFDYAYCIEQVKRYKRQQSPLSRLQATALPGRAAPRRGAKSETPSAADRSAVAADRAGRRRPGDPSRAPRGSGRRASRDRAPGPPPRSVARRSRRP